MSKENKIEKKQILFGEYRPWGEYLNLYDGDKCKVKKIVVKPGENPSYQVHQKRSEVWVVISGSGKVRLEDKLKDIKPADVIQIPAGAKHTIINDSKEEELVFIEVQTGTYFGEDDIIRLEDKYGRE